MGRLPGDYWNYLKRLGYAETEEISSDVMVDEILEPDGIFLFIKLGRSQLTCQPVRIPCRNIKHIKKASMSFYFRERLHL